MASVGKFEYDVKRSVTCLMTAGARVTRLAGDGPLWCFHLLADFGDGSAVKAIHILVPDNTVDPEWLLSCPGLPPDWLVEVWEWKRYQHKPTVQTVKRVEE